MGPGAFLSVSFSPLSFWSGSLVPRLWNGIPPTPLLLMARPSRLLRGSGGWLVGRRGAVGISFPPLVNRLVHLSPAGVLLLFCICVFFCVFCGFDSLRVLLARVVCLFVFFFLCWCSHARPWFLIRELGEQWSAFPVYPWSCVLLLLRRACLSFSFCGVAACCFFSFSFFAGVARLSVMFVLIGCAWGVLFSFACLLLL